MENVIIIDMDVLQMIIVLLILGYLSHKFIKWLEPESDYYC
jgi:hypothetical protein